MSSSFNLRGKMTLTVHAARNLANRELLGKMDPFAEVKLSGSKDQKFKTKVVKDGHKDPVWEQSYIFNLEGKEELCHVNVWNEATLGNDHIGRMDLSLDALDFSGTKRWYQLKDKENFTKQTGEICMTIIFEGNGLPDGSTAATTHAARLAKAAAGSPPVVSPVTTIAPPVVQQSQPYASQAPPQAYASQAPPQQYQQPPPQAYQQPPPQQYASQAPVYSQPPPQQYQQPAYQPPAQPMYQAPPQPQYAAPPMQPVYQAQAPAYPQQPVYQQPAPVYQQPIYQQPAPTMVYQQPAVVYQQPAAQTVVYTQHSGQIVGYWPNGQPRYAGQ